MSMLTSYTLQDQSSPFYLEDKKIPIIPVTKIAPNSIVSRQLSEVVDLDPYALTKNRSSKTTRLIVKRPSTVSSIDEESRLLQSAAKLLQLSQFTLFKPSFLEGNHNNDVYMISFEEEGIQDVVFKPGLAVAMRSTICYGLAQIIHASNALVPSQEGVASIMASQDINTIYQKLYAIDDRPLLINPKNLTKISPPEVNENRQTLCKISDNFFLLEHEGAFVKQPYLLSDIEVKVISSNQFELLSIDDKSTFYLVPSSKIYSITEHKETDYVKINDVFYKLQESDMGEIKLKFARVTPNHDKIANQEVLTTSFAKFDQEDPENKECPFEVLVPEDTYIYVDEMIDEENEGFTFNSEGKAFRASKTSIGVYQLTLSSDKKIESSKRFLIVHNKEKTQFFLVSTHKQQEIVVEDGKEFVLRCGQKHILEKIKKDHYQVIGRNVKGMVQKKVEDIFTGTLNPLDIRSPKLERDVFYARINREHFIESFIVTILLRPQDGKITDLSLSNVLFPIIDSSQLGCVLIDLDETLPPNNKYSIHPDFKNKEHTHIVRNGLMGFPQARSPLSKSERSEAVRLIERIISSRHEIESFLKKFVTKNDKEVNFSQDHLDATLEIITLMENFLETNKETNWTLEDLFFFIFPEYKQQWDILGTEPPELKAARIGLESQKELSKERKNSFRTNSFSEADND